VKIGRINWAPTYQSKQPNEPTGATGFGVSFRCTHCHDLVANVATSDPPPGWKWRTEGWVCDTCIHKEDTA
jgi:hypothetical protein